MGHKPSSNTPSNLSASQPQTQEPFSEEFVNSLFQTPTFLNQLDNYLGSKGNQTANDDDSDNIFDNEDEDDFDG
ncbi:hypothetical protein HanRHA438_Chr14g0633601 [Helianthus annuus]|uniref:Uncharacterized protein n=1 Tax=Helianthus annuus TaxID=4232 RepID=A0A251SEP0_HELAN|nr:hypothetical protein HanXRQr2_Chr14g0623611 [Helianthus annuus]KAJ0838749.1 hypothetical protein HanPSC8_Chr14g0598461 [Helianthus annuus]KAJ0852037.1 hypothetical protein HanRHA438_Chr14g0633601 [Helianthus annuus]